MKDGFGCSVPRDKGLSAALEKLLSQTKEQTPETNVKCKLKLCPATRGTERSVFR